MLDRGGCVLWLDIKRRLVPLGKEKLGEFLNLAMKGGSEGIVGWSTGLPGVVSSSAYHFPLIQRLDSIKTKILCVLPGYAHDPPNFRSHPPQNVFTL